MELHKVPKHQEEAVEAQDILVEGLLQMMLNIMGNVHDKAPTRKKEDRTKLEEARNKFQGPRTGPHGEHNFIDKTVDGNAQDATKPPGPT